MILDETIKREIGILILGIWAAFGFVLFELLDAWNLSPMWILFIGIVWYALDIFVAAYLWHVFKVRKEDVPGGSPVLTEVKSVPVNVEGTAYANARTKLSSDDEGIIDK